MRRLRKSGASVLKGVLEKLQRPFGMSSGYALRGKAQRQVRALVAKDESRPRDRN